MATTVNTVGTLVWRGTRRRREKRACTHPIVLRVFCVQNLDAKFSLVDSPMMSTTPPEINMAETDILMDVLRQLSTKPRFSSELKVEQREAF